MGLQGFELNISFPKNSPPLAALSDESIQPLPLEPKEPLKAQNGVVVLKAGEQKIDLKQMNLLRRKSQLALKKAHKIIPLSRVVKNSSEPSRVSRLLSAIEPIGMELSQKSQNYVKSPDAQYTPRRAALESTRLAAAETPAVRIEKKSGITTTSVTVPVAKVIPTVPPPAYVKAPSLSAPTQAPPEKQAAYTKSTNTENPGIQTLLNDLEKKKSEERLIPLVGEIQLGRGLAITENVKLSVAWELDNQKAEGQVDYSTGHYLVNIPQISGRVVAQLRDSTKRVLGEGLLDLTNVGREIENPTAMKIIIEPMIGRISGIVSSYLDSTAHIANADIRGSGQVKEITDKRGTYNISTLSQASELVLVAEAPEHWGTSVLSSGFRREEIPLFPRTTMKGLFSSIKEFDKQDEFGVIWGQIKRKGVPVSGVRVTLEGEVSARPLYLNALQIPDKQLTATTENGYFVFVGVRPGLHVVASSIEGLELPATIVASDRGQVAWALIEAKKSQVSGVVYDPQLQTPIRAKIQFVGLQERFETGAQGEFQHQIPLSQGVGFVSIDGGAEYLESVASFQKAGAKNLQLMAIKKTWIDEALVSVQDRRRPENGSVVGFVNGPEYHVAIQDYRSDEYQESGIYYFNGEGHLDTQVLSGAQGGSWFVIGNVEPGLKTLVISSADGEVVMTKLIMVKANAISTINTELVP